jgi:hypothetical protein
MAGLRLFDVAGHIHLAAICADGSRPPVFSEVCGDFHAAARWISQHNNDRRNIYWQPNRVRQGVSGKASACDIEAIRFFQVDIDPPKNCTPLNDAIVVAQLNALTQPPSFIIHSGGGVQAFWRLSQPLAAGEFRQPVERVNMGIAAITGGDHCHSIAHLMRVPATVNWPTAAKIKRGRGVTRATILLPDSGRTVTLEQMAGFIPPEPSRESERPNISVGDIRPFTAEDLGISRFDDLRYLIDAPDGTDRSKDTFRLARNMVERGFDDEQIIGILLNPANPIAAHCLENSNPERAAVRALSSAKRAVRSAGDQPAGNVANTRTDEAEPLPLIDAGALAGVSVDPREFIVSKLIPAALVTMFTAPGGGGKSHISLSISASVATGADAYGLPTTQAPAIYITAEDDDAENHRRLIGAANAHGVGIETFSGKLFLLSLVGRREKGLARFDANTNRMSVLPLFHELRATILKIGARFVVLDNVAHLFEGNENIRAQVAAFIGLLNALALETQCAILLISHPNKAGDSFSGSTAFQNQVRSHIHMEIDEKDPDVRRIRLAKANYARLEEPLRLRWHRGAFRLEASIPPNELNRSARHRREEAQFLTCLALRNAAKLPVSKHPKAGKTFAPKVFAAMPEGKGLTLQQFAGALARLLAAGTIAQTTLDYDKPGSPGHKAEGLLQVMEPEEADDEPL